MTTIRKNLRDGWEALDVISLDGGRALRVSTHKVGPQIVCSATVVTLTAGGGFVWQPFGDFRERLLGFQERCTEKAIASIHAKCMANIEAVKSRALAFYADKVQS